MLGINNYFFMIINNTYPCDPDSNNSFFLPNLTDLKLRSPKLTPDWQEIIQIILKEITLIHIFYKYENSLSGMNIQVHLKWHRVGFYMGDVEKDYR